MFDDFNRGNARFSVKGAFYDDVNFTFNLGLCIIEKLRLGYRHARLGPVLPHKVHYHLECSRPLRHRLIIPETVASSVVQQQTSLPA
jgi:hypothetical protein